jgi:hypothetical protein
VGSPNTYPTQFRLRSKESDEAELGAQPLFLSKHGGRVHAQKVVPIEIPMIIPFPRMLSAMPFRETVVYHHIDFEVAMSPVLRNGLLGVGSATHRTDLASGGNGIPNLKTCAGVGEMGIERIDFHPFDSMPEDDISAVVGEARL